MIYLVTLNRARQANVGNMVKKKYRDIVKTKIKEHVGYNWDKTKKRRRSRKRRRPKTSPEKEPKTSPETKPNTWYDEHGNLVQVDGTGTMYSSMLFLYMIILYILCVTSIFSI